MMVPNDHRNRRRRLWLRRLKRLTGEVVRLLPSLINLVIAILSDYHRRP
jgi:hypothetical protein